MKRIPFVLARAATADDLAWLRDVAGDTAGDYNEDDHGDVIGLPPKDGETLVVASTPTVDRVDDVVAAPWRLAAYRDNPVVPWAHDYRVPPVGRTTAIAVRGGRLVARIRWDDSEANPLGRTVAHQYADGFLSAVSVGFHPRKRIARSELGDEHPHRGERGMLLTDNDLLEISAVPVPANPEALAVRGYEPWWRAGPSVGGDDDAAALSRAWSAAPFADLPVEEDRGAPWSWSAADQDAVLGDADDPDWRRYVKAHLVVDPDRAETKAGYKLPIAKLSGGKLRVYFRGLVAAVAVLNGGRGGVDVPPDVRRAAYRTAAKYYDKFDLEPPPFRESAGLPLAVRDIVLDVVRRDDVVRAAIVAAVRASPSPSPRSGDWISDTFGTRPT